MYSSSWSLLPKRPSIFSWTPLTSLLLAAATPEDAEEEDEDEAEEPVEEAEEPVPQLLDDDVEDSVVMAF